MGQKVVGLAQGGFEVDLVFVFVFGGQFGGDLEGDAKGLGRMLWRGAVSLLE